MGTVAGILIAAILILTPVIYLLACFFLPFWIAVFRRRPDKWKVLAINFFLGWCPPGWAWAFVLSVWDDHLVPLWRE